MVDTVWLLRLLAYVTCRCVLDLRSCCREDRSRILDAAHGDYTQALSAAAAAVDELAHRIANEEPSACGADDAQLCTSHWLQWPENMYRNSADSTTTASSAGEGEDPDSGVRPDLQQHSGAGAALHAATCQAVSTASSSERSQPNVDKDSNGKWNGSCSITSHLPDPRNAGLSSAASSAGDGPDIASLHDALGDSEAEEDLAQLADVLQTCLTARVQAQYRVTSQAVTRCALGSWTATRTDISMLAALLMFCRGSTCACLTAQQCVAA